MKEKIAIDGEGLPDECPKCESDDLYICNDNGMECMECGYWFDADLDGVVIWAYASHPLDIS